MRPVIPQGYTTVPEDYVGQVYLMSQMHAYADACEKEILREVLHGIIAVGTVNAEELVKLMIEEYE